MTKHLVRRKRNNSDDSSRKEMQNLINFAEDLTKENPKSIFQLIQMVGMSLSSMAMCDVLFQDDGNVQKGIGFHDSINWVMGFDEIPHETEGESAWALELGSDIVLPWPWNKQRASEALTNIGKGKPSGEWGQDPNHRVQLIYPLGIGIVHGGNHSIMAGIVNHEGVIAGSRIIDIRSFLERYESDGVNVIEKATRKVVGVVQVFEFAALIELGRIAVKLGLEPPQITSVRISKEGRSDDPDATDSESIRHQAKIMATNRYIEEVEQEKSSSEESRKKVMRQFYGNPPRIKFFPGNAREPGPVEYYIIPAIDNHIRRAIVFVRQSSGPGTSYINNDEGRDILINSIIETDLKGVRIEFIRVIFALESDDGQVFNTAHEFRIRVDLDDYTRKGNPHKIRTIRKSNRIVDMFSSRTKELGVYSRDIVAGSVRVFTDFEERRSLAYDEVKELYLSVSENIPNPRC